MTTNAPAGNREPWLVIKDHPVIHIHPPIHWQPGGPGWIFVTDDGVAWEAGAGLWAVRAAALSADTELDDREQVHAQVEAARPARAEIAVAIQEKGSTAWGSWFFRVRRSPRRYDSSPPPRGIGAYYSLIKRCPCGAGEIGCGFKDERQQSALACEGCKGKLLARLVDADLLRGDAKESCLFRTTHFENYLRRKGCELVAIAENEPFPIREGHLTILGPSVPCSFVIVPDALADTALRDGRLS